MKNILVIVDVYPPEVNSASQIMHELSNGLKKRGHNVWVLTSYPGSYLPKEFQGKTFETFYEERGVKVIRARTLPLKKVNFLLRGVANLILPFNFYSAAKKYITGPIDEVIVFSPPLTLCLTAEMVKKHWGAHFILLLGDIFPQNAIDLGILKGWKHKPAIWIFQWLEKRAYLKADKIRYLSEAGRQYLIKHKSVPPEKVSIIENWIDLGLNQRLTQDISFRKKWGLENKFIFVFGGVIGPAQGLEFVIEVAKRIKHVPEIVFLMVGDGTDKTKITKLAADSQLTNIIFKDFISKDEYPYLVKDSDVGLVCLSDQNKTPFIPGKFLGYLAMAKPVLAFMHKECDGFDLMEKAKCGRAMVYGDLDKAAKDVLEMYQNRSQLPRMGESGLQYAKENLDIEVCLNKIEKLFRQ